MKKSFAVILAALILASVPACSSGGTGTETQKSAGSVTQTTAAESTADPRDTDDLPELDYNGATFGMFSRNRTTFHGAIDTEELTGDQLNDAIYERNRAVEERLNIVIEEETATDTPAAKTAIEAGDDSYKLVHARCVYTVQYAANGLGYHWDKVKNIDLDKNYWYDSINQNLTMNNICFTGAGAYNITSFDFTHVILFNKEIMSDLKLESPYTVVRNGDWTWDKFMEYASVASNDTNGDGKMDMSDTYGFCTSIKQVPPCFLEAGGFSFLQKDKNDKPVFTMDTDEACLTAYTKLFEMMWDSGIRYEDTTTEDVPQTSIDLFQQNQALMMDSTFYKIQSFREMDADFGVLPYPKYTKEQETYYSRIEGCELPLIPSSLKQEDADMTGAFLEAMASYSYANVTDVYYEVYLKSKLTRDSESAEMFDIIFANRIFDLGDTVWCPELRDGFIYTLLRDNDRSITSTIKSNVNTINSAIESIVTGFTK